MLTFLRERCKSYTFYIRLFLLSFLPVLTYTGMTGDSITSWPILWDFIVKFVSNPYLLFIWTVTLIQSFRDSTNNDIKIEKVKLTESEVK